MRTALLSSSGFARSVALASLIAACIPLSAGAVASFSERADQLRQAPGSIGTRYPPGEAIVRYRDRGSDAVAADVGTLVQRGLPFGSVTASGSDSLDRLHSQYEVAAATPIFRQARSAADVVGQAVTGSSVSSPRGPPRDALSHIYLLQVPESTDLIRMCEAFEADPSIEYCHPNLLFDPFHVPNDEYLGTAGAWGQSYADLWGLTQIQAHEAWHEIGDDPRDVTVAVVDSGVDYNHPDIADNVWRNPGELSGSGVFVPGDLNGDGCPGICGVDDDGDGLVDEDSAGCGSDGANDSGAACSYRDDLDFDDDENGFADDHIGWDFFNGDNDPIDDAAHGTHVAGTIAATIDNGIGIAGVAPHARIMILKGLGPRGGPASALVAALKYAVDNEADVINNSWGSAASVAALDVLVDVIEYATANGVVVVSAAGNSATKLGGLSRGHAPASIPDSIAVSAFDHLDEMADFSNFGVGIDVAAPGGDSSDDTSSSTSEYLNILSLRADGLFENSVFRVDDDYLRFRGTSMASPHVAGVAALVRTVFPQYGVEEVRQVMKLSSDDTGTPGWDPASGSGRVNAFASTRFDEPCSALIRQPATRDVVRGPVEIRGMAAGYGAIGGTNFEGYRLEITSLDQPSATDWIPIHNATTPVAGTATDSLLATWVPATSLPDGEYTLRLVVTDDRGRDFESRIRLDVDLVDPPEMTGWPQLPEFGKDQLIPMMPTVADLDTDGDLEILLGPYAWHHDGAPISNHALGFFTNYPFTLSILAGIHGPPVVGDIDGDGKNEVVLVHHNALLNAGAIHVFEHDGQPKPGWPIARSYSAAIGRTAMTVLADIDGDAVLDVIAVDSDAFDALGCRLEVFHGDGSAILDVTFAGDCLTIPTVADLDGDGRMEIIILGVEGRVFAVDHTGQPAANWPQNFRIEDRFDYIAPSVGDLDGDGELDIVVPAFSGKIYAFASNGLAREGWPVQVAAGDPSIPALADLDRDGRLEVIVGDREGSVHVFDYEGSARAGWPKMLDGPANTTPAVADIDGDGLLDIVAVTGDRKIHAWDAGGREIIAQGWPIATGEYAADSPFSDELGLAAPPLVADLDADGDREVVAFTRNVHVWDLPDVASATSREWPVYRANQQGSGNVDEDLVARPTSDPRIYASPAFSLVADIESFPISFDLNSRGASIAAAEWSVHDENDPARNEITGWVDGVEADLAAPQVLPNVEGLVSRVIRLPEVGVFRVRASIQTEASPDAPIVRKHRFWTSPIEVIEIAPANPTAEIIPFPTVFARTTAAARVHLDLVPGLRRFDYRIVRPGEHEPILGTLGIADLGDVNELGDRDMSEPTFIGFPVGTESPIDAAFSVNEVGEYDVEVSILGHFSELRRTIEIGSTRAQFRATEIVDSDGDGWFDIEDNCLSVINGIDQAPADVCAELPCIGNQIDTDGDGYGNACDGDLDGDGEVTGDPESACDGVASDWCLLHASLGKTAGDPGYAADADCNGDDRIDAFDEACLRTQLGRSPGPSGLECAGTFPCFKPIGDADNDGIANGDDSCVFVADDLARDTDQDGFGDGCDADYDHDGIVGFTDFGRFAAAIGSTDGRFDHNGDGLVGFADFGFLVRGYGHPPGPSGLDVPAFLSNP